MGLWNTGGLSKAQVNARLRAAGSIEEPRLKIRHRLARWLRRLAERLDCSRGYRQMWDRNYWH
jgi:hypothetical protein